MLALRVKSVLEIFQLGRKRLGARESQSGHLFKLAIKVLLLAGSGTGDR
jgi:hypothetical protein